MIYHDYHDSMDWFSRENLNRKPWFLPWKIWWFSVIFPLNLTIFLSFGDDKARSHGWPRLLQGSHASHHGSCGHVALATEVQWGLLRWWRPQWFFLGKNVGTGPKMAGDLGSRSSFFCIENPVWFKKIRKDSPRKLLKFSLIPHLVANYPRIVSGLVHPSDLHGIFVGLIHSKITGVFTNPLTIRG